MTIYSHSRLSTFEQCPQKYDFKYIKKIPKDFDNSIEAFLGSKVHDTLEWVYKQTERELNLDDVIKYFVELWNREYKSDIKIVKADVTTETYFNKGIKFLINYYLKHTPFKDNTIETEKKIFITLDGNREYLMMGYIDRLVHHKDTNIFEIHDYKTGAAKSQRDLDQDRQLALYSLGVREAFKEAKDVKLIWHFLDSNQQFTSVRTIEQLQELKKEIMELIKKIESTTEFPTNKSILCNWCEYKSKCPEFTKQSLQEFM
jgi:putative RecB family exonuclease